ncbi:MAG: hypothetical protein II865_00725 [Bacteroidales bacterium]|nr:hypothetical protein [Bacteroidales bacterium]
MCNPSRGCGVWSETSSCYRYVSPDGLTRHGRIATGHGYGSPNGLREDTVPIEALVSGNR